MSRSAELCTSTCRILSVTTVTRPRRLATAAIRSVSRPGRQLAAILGRSEAAVPTHHHQAIDRLGAGLVATAWTDDGMIEAVEFGQPAGEFGQRDGTSGAFMVAVQWHPEAGDDPSLFAALIAAASQATQRPADA